MENIYIIAEAVNSSLQILTNEDTGFAVTFDDQNIAEIVADEICDYPHRVIQVVD